MSQSSLFDGTPSWRSFDLPGAEVALLEGFITFRNVGKVKP